MKTAAALALPLLTLAACAQDLHRYPSLAPRAVEERGFAEPVVPVVEATPDPALDARLATARQTLDRLAKGFSADAAKADAAANLARGGAVGSDAWLEAQTALAQLDDWRAQTSSLLTDVDTLASDRAAQLLPVYPALSTMRDAVAAEAERQGDAIARIQDRLPRA